MTPAPPSDSLRSKVVYSVLGNVLAPMAGIAAAPVLARGLGTDGRGDLAAASAPIMLTTAVGLVGLQDALTYFVARHARERGHTLRHTLELMLLLGAISSVVTWFLATPLSAGDRGLESLIRITAMATIPNFLALVPPAFVAGLQRWRLVALQSAAFGLLRLALLVGLMIAGRLTPTTALLVTIAAPVVTAVIFLPEIRRALRESRAGAAPDPGLVSRGRLLGYGSRIWIGSLSGVVLSRLDQLVMVPLAGKRALGLYAVAVTVGEIPVILSIAMRNVVFAADAHEMGGAGADQDELTRRLQQMARISTQITLLASAAVAATSWWWMPRLFGAEFRDSVHLVNVLLIAAVSGAAGSVAGAGLNARNNPGLRSWSMTIAAVANVAVLLALTPTYGAMGAALSSLVGAAVAGNLNVFWLHRRYGMSVRGFYGVHREDVALLRRVVAATTERVRRRG